jgi:hypothetical protein
MATTSAFEWVSQELERITSLERLEARGTLRLVLKKAGLEAGQVTSKQMEVVLRERLPGELRSRGIEEGDNACQHLLRGLLAANLCDDEPSAESPEQVFQRLGGS